MGAGNFDIQDFGHQATKAVQSENSGFAASSMNDEFNPAKVKTRFSKKSAFNGFRDPITALIGLDVTASMGDIPKSLLTGKLGNLMVDLQKTFNQPNENLQISFAGIGDAKTDDAPLQVTHFESDNRFAQQLPKIWLEGGGGGNGGESYNLLWWYAANKTHLNYVETDKRKGILITIGDDKTHPGLTSHEIGTWLDPDYSGGNISNKILIEAAQEQFETYHIIITDGDAFEHSHISHWEGLLGHENVVQSKSDNVHNAIADIIKRHRPPQKNANENSSPEQWRIKNIQNFSDSQWLEVLSYTVCPLTRQFMTNPVVWGEHKKAYEKGDVVQYVKDNQLDPITQNKLKPSEFFPTPNLNIKQLCSDYQEFFNQLPEKRQQSLIEQALSHSPQMERKNQNQNQNQNLNPNPNLNVLFQPKKSEKEVDINSVEKLLECPLTLEVMKDPYTLVETGRTFEKSAIDEWLKNHNTDPISNQVLHNKTLIPNRSLKDLCDKYHEEQSKNAMSVSK